MRARAVGLAIALIVVFGMVIYLEKTRPAVSSIVSNSDIAVEEAGLSGADLQRIQEKEEKYPRAKELVMPEGYVNIENITIKEHIGKDVILVDFWTYSCINCQRTLPYLEAWYDKYKNEGLVIIGVHTPEFRFEQDYDNLIKATKKYGVKYPVVQDNDYQTWTAYGNRYWPRKYLIDIDGFIVYDHIGEGAYVETEHKIQSLLAERNKVLGIEKEIGKGISEVEAETPNFAMIYSPEIYLGYEHAAGQIGNEQGWIPESSVEYSLPTEIKKDKFYLEGIWKSNKDNMELESETGKIVLKYNAKNANLVAGSPEPKQIRVRVDEGEEKVIDISAFDLYRVAEESYEEHTLEIEVPKGLMAYSFTFG